MGGWEVEETDYDDAGQRWAEYIMFLISHKRLKAVRFLETVKPSALIRLNQRLLVNLRDHNHLLLQPDFCSDSCPDFSPLSSPLLNVDR